MKLTNVLKNLNYKTLQGNLEIEITNISSDSRKIKEKGLFFAISGFSANGTSFIPSAIENGAIAIIIEKNSDLSNIEINKNIPVIEVTNIRYALAITSCNLYDYPSRKLKVIGITGTKGKTTSTFMTKAILEKHGYKVGLIGSIAVYIGKKQLEITDRTTPESYKIQEYLNLMVKENVDIAIIEVSSQAMKLDRVTGCNFDIALFTNLTEDHISPKEHSDMEDYFQAKLSLLKLAPKVVTNIDNDYGKKVFETLKNKELITFSMKDNANTIAKNLNPANAYTDFTLIKDGQENEIRVSIPGEYMVYNALGAISVTSEFDATPDDFKNALDKISVFGRSELVPNKLNLTIMIDYAHTPSSLESILKTVKPHTKGKVICTWGVGGDRDKTKRPIMGRISGTYADYTILTSDQVRTENPINILKEIELGLKEVTNQYEIILNRTEALRKAIRMTKKEDILVIPGLGNDLYIEYMGTKYPYNEREIITNIIEEIITEKQILEPGKLIPVM